MAVLLSSLFYKGLVSITKQVSVGQGIESYLADTATNGCLVLVARRGSVVHLILPLYSRCGKFCLLDGLLTLGAHHFAVCGRMFQEIVSTGGMESWQKLDAG